MLDWAKTRGFREGENPARWPGHLEYLLLAPGKVRKVQHHAALPYAELAAFMTELRAHQGIAARALELTILTAARTGEAIGARWDELDLAARLRTVPAERMKAGKEHRVPLSDAALAILDDLQRVRHGVFVFPGERAGRPISNMAMSMLLRRMGRSDLTVHGFRSTLKDWVEDQTDFPGELAELALAHNVGDKVEQAYRRGDGLGKRFALMEAWAQFTRRESIEQTDNRTRERSDKLSEVKTA